MTALIAASLLLTGCSGGGEQDKPGAEGAPAAASGAGVEKVDLDDVLVEQTIAVPGRPEDKVTVGVLDLTVRDKVMVLRVVITPELASESDDAVLTQTKALGGEYFTPLLVDEENLKQYSIIEQFGPLGWKSDENSKGTNGSPMLAWAYFSAPEDPVESMDLLLENFRAFTDVPITR
jgi:hypothetical protein